VLADPAETGAVTVSLPEDVQGEAFDWPAAFLEPRVWHVRRPPPEPEAVARAVAVLRNAERPLIVCGGGAIYAEAEAALGELAQAFGIPSSSRRRARERFPGTTR
jgi:3D-(3,5/4)-trihydroxycyclohexane-1,2-dione acylhydrolase (decyclizing)